MWNRIRTLAMAMSESRPNGREMGSLMLEVIDLEKQYPNKKAISGVTFSIDQGEIVALLGKNGAGKTTIMNSIAGIIQATRGKILYRNQDLRVHPEHLKKFGILIRAEFFDYLNVEENLRLLMHASGYENGKMQEERITQILSLVGLEKEKKSKVKSFSFGMKQRLGLAQALISDIEFLMLDEPFVGLDPVGKELFKKAITDLARHNQVGVLLSSHDLADVQDICDRVIMIRGGKIVFNDTFRKRKKIIITTKYPCETGWNYRHSGIECRGNQMIMSDPQMLELAVRRILKNNPVTDIMVYENNLMELFEEDAGDA